MFNKSSTSAGLRPRRVIISKVCRFIHFQTKTNETTKKNTPEEGGRDDKGEEAVVLSVLRT